MLVVRLRVVPRALGQDRHHFAHLGLHAQRGPPLLVVLRPDRRLVLRLVVAVVAAHARRFEPLAYEALEAESGRVERDAHGLGVPVARAHARVSRGGARAPRVADRAAEYARALGPLGVDAPESALREDEDLGAGRRRRGRLGRRRSNLGGRHELRKSAEDAKASDAGAPPARRREGDGSERRSRDGQAGEGPPHLGLAGQVRI